MPVQPRTEITINTTGQEGKINTQAQYIAGKLRQEKKAEIIGRAAKRREKAREKITKAEQKAGFDRDASRAKINAARAKRDQILAERKKAPKKDKEKYKTPLENAKREVKVARNEFKEKNKKTKKTAEVKHAKRELRGIRERGKANAHFIGAVVRIAGGEMKEPLAKLVREKRVKEVLEQREVGGVAGLVLRHLPTEGDSGKGGALRLILAKARNRVNAEGTKLAIGLGAQSKDQIRSINEHHRALENLANQEGKKASEASFGERVIEKIVAGSEVHDRLAEVLFGKEFAGNLLRMTKSDIGSEEREDLREQLGEELEKQLREYAKQHPEDPVLQEFVGNNATNEERRATAEGLIDLFANLHSDDLEFLQNEFQQQEFSLEKAHKGSGYLQQQYSVKRAWADFALKNVKYVSTAAVAVGLIPVSPFAAPAAAFISAGIFAYVTQKHKMQYDRGIALIDKTRGKYRSPQDLQGALRAWQWAWGKEIDLTTSDKEFNKAVNFRAARRGVAAFAMSFVFGFGGHTALSEVGHHIHSTSHGVNEAVKDQITNAAHSGAGKGSAAGHVNSAFLNNEGGKKQSDLFDDINNVSNKLNQLTSQGKKLSTPSTSVHDATPYGEVTAKPDNIWGQIDDGWEQVEKIAKQVGELPEDIGEKIQKIPEGLANVVDHIHHFSSAASSSKPSSSPTLHSTDLYTGNQNLHDVPVPGLKDTEIRVPDNLSFNAHGQLVDSHGTVVASGFTPKGNGLDFVDAQGNHHELVLSGTEKINSGANISVHTNAQGQAIDTHGNVIPANANEAYGLTDYTDGRTLTIQSYDSLGDQANALSIPTGPGAHDNIVFFTTGKTPDGHNMWQFTPGDKTDTVQVLEDGKLITVTQDQACQMLNLSRGHLETWLNSGNPAGSSSDFDYNIGQNVLGRNVAFGHVKIVDGNPVPGPDGKTVEFQQLGKIRGHAGDGAAVNANVYEFPQQAGVPVPIPNRPLELGIFNPLKYTEWVQAHPGGSVLAGSAILGGLVGAGIGYRKGQDFKSGQRAKALLSAGATAIPLAVAGAAVGATFATPLGIALAAPYLAGFTIGALRARHSTSTRSNTASQARGRGHSRGAPPAGPTRSAPPNNAHPYSASPAAGVLHNQPAGGAHRRAFYQQLADALPGTTRQQAREAYRAAVDARGVYESNHNIEDAAERLVRENANNGINLADTTNATFAAEALLGPDHDQGELVIARDALRRMHIANQVREDDSVPQGDKISRSLARIQSEVDGVANASAADPYQVLSDVRALIHIYPGQQARILDAADSAGVSVGAEAVAAAELATPARPVVGVVGPTPTVTVADRLQSVARRLPAVLTDPEMAVAVAETLSSTQDFTYFGNTADERATNLIYQFTHYNPPLPLSVRARVVAKLTPGNAPEKMKAVLRLVRLREMPPNSNTYVIETSDELFTVVDQLAGAGVTPADIRGNLQAALDFTDNAGNNHHINLSPTELALVAVRVEPATTSTTDRLREGLRVLPNPPVPNEIATALYEMREYLSGLVTPINLTPQEIREAMDVFPALSPSEKYNIARSFVNLFLPPANPTGAEEQAKLTLAASGIRSFSTSWNNDDYSALAGVGSLLIENTHTVSFEDTAALLIGELGLTVEAQKKLAADITRIYADRYATFAHRGVSKVEYILSNVLRASIQDSDDNDQVAEVLDSVLASGYMPPDRPIDKVDAGICKRFPHATIYQRAYFPAKIITSTSGASNSAEILHHLLTTGSGIDETEYIETIAALQDSGQNIVEILTYASTIPFTSAPPSNPRAVYAGLALSSASAFGRNSEEEKAVFAVISTGPKDQADAIAVGQALESGGISHDAIRKAMQLCEIDKATQQGIISATLTTALTGAPSLTPQIISNSINYAVAFAGYKTVNPPGGSPRDPAIFYIDDLKLYIETELKTTYHVSAADAAAVVATIT